MWAVGGLWKVWLYWAVTWRKVILVRVFVMYSRPVISSEYFQWPRECEQRDLDKVASGCSVLTESYYYFIWYYITLHCVLLCYITLHYITLLYYVMLFYIILCYIILMFCCVSLSYVLLRCAIIFTLYVYYMNIL